MDAFLSQKEEPHRVEEDWKQELRDLSKTLDLPDAQRKASEPSSSVQEPASTRRRPTRDRKKPRREAPAEDAGGLEEEEEKPNG